MMDTSRPRSKPLPTVGDSAQWKLLPDVTSFDPPQTAELLQVQSFRQRQERSVYAWELTGLFCLFVLSRVTGLTRQSLWYDEGYTVALALAPNFREFWHRFGTCTTSEHLQPLYYFLIFLWSRIAGVSDSALRLPSALFSIGSGIAAYSAIRHISGGRSKIALLSAALLATSSFSLYYAQEARPYALLQLLSFSLLAIFIRNRVAAANRPLSGNAQIGFGVVCVLCLLGSAFTALLVFCLALSDLLMMRDWKRWITSWSSPAAVSATALLAYVIPALRTMPSFIQRDVTGIKQPLWMNIGYSLYGIVYGTTLQPAPSQLRGPQKLQVVLASWPAILPAALVILALACGSYLLLHTEKQRSAVISIPLLTLALYALLFFGVFGAVGHLNVLPRHASALFALLFVVVSAAASLVSKSRSKLATSVFLLGLGGWLVLNLVSVAGYYWNSAFRKDDYREAAAVLSGYSVPTFVVAGDLLLLEHYGAEPSDANIATTSNLSEFIKNSSGGAPEVVLLFNQYRNYHWDSTDLNPAQVMSPEYGCRTTKHLADIDIYACRYLARGPQGPPGATEATVFSERRARTEGWSPGNSPAQ
jgi:MFS family permease